MYLSNHIILKFINFSCFMVYNLHLYTYYHVGLSNLVTLIYFSYLHNSTSQIINFFNNKIEPVLFILSYLICIFWVCFHKLSYIILITDLIKSYHNF